MTLEKTVTLKVESKTAIERLEDVERQLEQISTATTTADKATKSTTKSIGFMGVALKGLGIGAIITAVKFLADKFSENQVVMDKVATSAAIVGDIFNKLSDVVVSLVSGLGLLGKAVGKVLKGEFKEAGDLAKQSFDGLKESVVGNNESFGDFIKNARESAKETVAFANNITKMRNEVKLADAQQRQLQLTYQREAELQRQLRDDISLTFEERIAANEKLAIILDEQFAEEQALAQKKIDLAELELSRNKTNIDLQVALIDAKTELADLDERITGQRSEQLTNLNALEKEYQDSIKETTKVAKDSGKAEVKIAKLTTEAKLDIIATSMMQIASLMGTESKAAKALAISSTLINTYQAAAAALSGPPTGAGPVFGPIVAAGAIASGLANVAKIKATKLPYGDGGGGVSGGSPSVPQSGLGASLVPNLEGIQNVAVGETQPVQAFVVENDISNAQALQEELDIQATL